MTRLTEDWIRNIEGTIGNQDAALKAATGLSLAGIAAKACGISEETIREMAGEKRVAAVPITTGQGVIGSFSNAVAAIARQLGFEAFVTDETDVAGIYEAYRRDAQILFLADDRRFIALDATRGKIAENNGCTARGYVAALEGAAGSLSGRKVLLIGCGPVGLEMLAELEHRQAVPVIYDRDEELLRRMGANGYETIDDPSRIRDHELILDATPQGGWINKGMLHPDVWYVTPGVPLSLDEEAYAAFKNKVIHDYLPIGTAVMLGELCR